MSRFRFVSEHHESYGIKRLCQVLGVSRSGFYAWTTRGPSTHAQRDAELGALVVEVHSRSRRTYGSPRCMPSSVGLGTAPAASGSPV